MKMLVRALTIASVVAVATSPVPLGAQGVAGRWIAEFDRSVRNENGNVSTGDRTKALLVLQQRGDSVTGTLEILNAPTGPGGRPATPRQLRGTISGNKVSLSSEVEARVNVNGEESVRKLTIVYDLTLDGDKLEGTMIARSADREIPGRPFVARREKS
jgi:hypothetical protein